MSWSSEDKTRAMVVLAAHAGNSKAAAEALRHQHNLPIDASKLRSWRISERREEYERILADMPDMTSVVINETLETARLAAQAERLAIQRTLADLEAGTCKDPARAARDLSHIKAMNVEKYLTLTGRPSQIIEHQTPDQLVAALLREKVFVAVEGDADGTFEIDDADVIEIAGELPAG